MYGWKCISIYGLNEIKFIFEFHSGFFFFYKKALNNEPKPFPNTTATYKFKIRFKV